MAAERDLAVLLKQMKPEMQPGVFVFCTIAASEPIPATVTPLLTFREPEGTTLVIPREDAERAGLNYAFASHMITLTVQSALDAVGFLAVITTRLAAAGISVNAVSAYHHDHLFVPKERAEDALAILRAVSGAQ